MKFGSWGAALSRRVRSLVFGAPSASGAAEASAPPEDSAFPWEKAYPRELHWRVHIRPEPLYAVLDDSVARYPDRTCIDFLGRRYTYAEIGGLVRRAAKGLQDLGIKKGDRVGLLMTNSPYYVICYFAILKTGATVVNYNPLYSASQIVSQMRDSGTETMITLDLKFTYAKAARGFGESPLERIVVCSMRKALPFADGIRFSIQSRRQMAAIPDDSRHIDFDKLTDNDGVVGAVEVDSRTDIAVLQYTGGTTGTSKAAMLSHANLFSNSVQTEMWAIGTEYGKERILAVLPFSHAFGMSAVMNVGIVLGAELIVLPRFKVEEVLEVIGRTKPTIFIGVPSMFSAIAAWPDVANCDLSSLSLCIAGGAPLPSQVQKAFENMASCTLVEGYGLTEAGPIVAANPFRGENRLGSVGLPLPGTVIEIIDPKDRRTPMPRGQRGEICVTGPQVMVGYLARPRENEIVLANGRLHTGDIGYLDADGYLYLVDRIKDLILSGGFNVYPRAVEEAILRHPAVAQVAVHGVPDDILGEVVKAVVSLKRNAVATAADIRTFLADQLASFEIPRFIEFADDIGAVEGGGQAPTDADVRTHSFPTSS